MSRPSNKYYSFLNDISMKLCTGCKEEKSVNDFYKKSSGKCKECRREVARNSRKLDPEKFRNRDRDRREKRRPQQRNAMLMKKYGVGSKWVIDRLVDQGFKCSICPTSINEKTCKVDHCHFSGTVRGLLCSSCNIGIGHFRDNVERLISAAMYLEAFEQSKKGE